MIISKEFKKNENEKENTAEKATVLVKETAKKAFDLAELTEKLDEEAFDLSNLIEAADLDTANLDEEAFDLIKAIEIAETVKKAYKLVEEAEKAVKKATDKLAKELIELDENEDDWEV